MRLSLHLCAASFALIATAPASALVVSPMTLANESAPPGLAQWHNVGDRGIYLGNSWVLTAFHVGPGTTSFGAFGSYSAVPGSSVRINNPSGMGLTTVTDLVLYRINGTPSLPPLTLASATPPIDAEIVMVGDGWGVSPGTQETRWNVTGSGDMLTWTEHPMGDVHGYKSNQSKKRWGTNLVEDDEPFAGEGDADHTVVVSTDDPMGPVVNGQVISFFTEFDKPGQTDGPATSAEAQAQSGDSGSAVFYNIGGSWVLAGVTHAILTYEDQPNLGTSAVYGNLTLIADLSTYAPQIYSVVGVPEAGGFLLVGTASAAGMAMWGLRRRRSA